MLPKAQEGRPEDLEFFPDYACTWGGPTERTVGAQRAGDVRVPGLLPRSEPGRRGMGGARGGAPAWRGGA